jgi:hypothetical protein
VYSVYVFGENQPPGSKKMPVEFAVQLDLAMVVGTEVRFGGVEVRGAGIVVGLRVTLGRVTGTERHDLGVVSSAKTIDARAMQQLEDNLMAFCGYVIKIA